MRAGRDRAPRARWAAPTRLTRAAGSHTAPRRWRDSMRSPSIGPHPPTTAPVRGGGDGPGRSARGNDTAPHHRCPPYDSLAGRAGLESQHTSDVFDDASQLLTHRLPRSKHVVASGSCQIERSRWWLRARCAGPFRSLRAAVPPPTVARLRRVGYSRGAGRRRARRAHRQRRPRGSARACHLPHRPHPLPRCWCAGAIEPEPAHRPDRHRREGDRRPHQRLPRDRINWDDAPQIDAAFPPEVEIV